LGTYTSWDLYCYRAQRRGPLLSYSSRAALLLGSRVNPLTSTFPSGNVCLSCTADRAGSLVLHRAGGRVLHLRPYWAAQGWALLPLLSSLAPIHPRMLDFPVASCTGRRTRPATYSPAPLVLRPTGVGVSFAPFCGARRPLFSWRLHRSGGRRVASRFEPAVLYSSYISRWVASRFEPERFSRLQALSNYPSVVAGGLIAWGGGLSPPPGFSLCKLP